MENNEIKNANEVLERMFLSPRLNYSQIIENGLLENLSGVNEIAKVRKSFRDIGSKAFEGKWDEEYGDFRVTDLVREHGKEGVIFSSHCDNPDPRYVWTSDYIEYAPNGHPAKGHLIFAKIDGLDSDIETPSALSILNGPSMGGIIISSERFAICDDYKECEKWGNPKGFLDSWIEGFEERNGLMVPILSRVQKRRTWRPAHTEYHENGLLILHGPGYSHQTFESQYDPKGFGPLRIDLEVKRPICSRPGSWIPGTGFNSYTGSDSGFFAIDKKNINSILDGEENENTK